jgi:hypothetical protein
MANLLHVKYLTLIISRSHNQPVFSDSKIIKRPYLLTRTIAIPIPMRGLLAVRSPIPMRGPFAVPVPILIRIFFPILCPVKILFPRFPTFSSTFITVIQRAIGRMRISFFVLIVTVQASPENQAKNIQSLISIIWMKDGWN